MIRIKTLEELPSTIKHASVIATFHKGETLRKVKNTFMYMKPETDVPLIVFMQDPTDYAKYPWVTTPNTYAWIPEEEFEHLAQVRRYIQKKFTEQGFEWIVLMDDDVRFTVRDLKAPTKYKHLWDGACPTLRKAVAEDASVDYNDMLIHMYRTMKRGNYAVVSPVQRFGSHNKIRDVVDNRMLHVWLLNLTMLAEKEVFFDDRYTTVSDFRFLFDVAKAGLHTCTIVKYVHDDYVSMNTKGGCNEYRNGPERIEVQNRCVKQLASDYPEFCRAVWEQHSPYNTEGAFNPKINWRSVHEYAVAHEK